MKTTKIIDAIKKANQHLNNVEKGNKKVACILLKMKYNICLN